MLQLIRKKSKPINTYGGSSRSNKYTPNYSSLKCGICKAEIKTRASVYRTGVHIRVICESCYKKFSEDDIELMLNLFTAFGGYFGKYKKPEYILYIILKELKEKYREKGYFFNADEINIKILHKALLYGVSPKKYFQGLKNHF
ncbi:MAG: hypothetical protein ACFE9T_10965 [Promethearchaeota archaeon]